MLRVMQAQLQAHMETCLAAFCDKAGLEPSTVAQRAAGDWRFFDRLKDGRSFRVDTYDKVMAWFAANWPDGHAWPKGVPRPEKTAKAEVTAK